MNKGIIASSNPNAGISCLREQVFLRIPDPSRWIPKTASRLQERLATRVARLFPTPITPEARSPRDSNHLSRENYTQQ